ncbi:MAG: glutaredoxin family protein [Rickettsiales bacterium]|jgi:glutaredoxin|nr:glutaredoxin family protein [Rickettsiales bacterium]
MSETKKTEKTNAPEIIIFYSPTCPYCHRALEFLGEHLPDISAELIEVGGDPENHRRFLTALETFGLESRGIPLIIVGNKVFQGFDIETGEKIITAVKKK